MKKSLLTAAVMAGIVVLSIDLAQAHDFSQQSTMGCDHMREGHMGDMGPWHHGFGHGFGFFGPLLRFDGLKLTDAQKAKLKDLFDSDHMKEFKDRVDQMHALHQQLREILTAPGPVDRTKLQEVERKISDLRAECTSKRIETEIRVHDILTKEQLEEIAHRSNMSSPPSLPSHNGEAVH
ncbi:MAG: Spy/CpxP family protein refolding chaperone [Acetobacter sp.]|nr:Spy/CpxP family protein refolding chaperone [Acetobacter sp.]